MLGLPAMSVPVGASASSHMPVGLQLVGQPWREATLLRVAAALEAALGAAGLERPRPQVYLNPITGRSSLAGAGGAAAGAEPQSEQQQDAGPK